MFSYWRYDTVFQTAGACIIAACVLGSSMINSGDSSASASAMPDALVGKGGPPRYNFMELAYFVSKVPRLHV